MTLLEIVILLFIVTDPFGNLPFILAILKNEDDKKFRRSVAREILFAYVILLIFLFFGNQILIYLNISEFALTIAGGIILFLISIHMIFKGPGDVFTDEYSDDPVFVPIAMPSIAGPSALTTLMVIQSKGLAPWQTTFTALTIVMFLAAILLVFSRTVSKFMGRKGLNALGRLMGMLLNLISVNMIMNGVKAFLAE